jgi:RNA polymerase II subunit A-like phosphatase
MVLSYFIIKFSYFFLLPYLFFFRALFPCGDDLVCIIDDREDVWQGCGNLVQVKPYHFFRHTGDINALPGLEKGNSSRLAETANKLCVNDSQNKDNKNGVSESLKEIEQLSPHNLTKEIDSEKNEENTENEKTETEVKETNNEDTKVNVKENADSSNTQLDTTSKMNKVNKESMQEDASLAKTEKDNNKQESPKVENNIVDEDDDDYLLYLEDILRRIHNEFYATLDQGNGRKSLRNIIPRVRSQVLKGLCLTFSGLIPTHQKLHQSRAYKVARAFGAEVTQVRNTFLYFCQILVKNLVSPFPVIFS